MIFHIRIRKWMGRMRFMLLFLAFTFAMYHILLMVTRFIEPMPKYKAPAGGAVKVFHNEHAAIFPSVSMGERLKLFYWIGE
ncbi:DUF4227 family protein [Paenibacillus naphthalenovorans]|uniref:Uncharacterized protein n=1 Tax=Paenibacillus naphthalenovorans TaxID=162209 RepID=A0A0U2U993_9BACL|nr:DUF4227 family protein [Paenibacillus naphthalenovorans]ALS22760.1 hypothetical protein IJ22_23870 [Paenibacillus naphthalenovorans]GCL70555.1 DUF4227 domain-containing protein [Paenibacillus naphthalenovorans]SDH78560.1 Protein of unknown function [Paenibacillus naphthalenovorans]